MPGGGAEGESPRRRRLLLNQGVLPAKVNKKVTIHNLTLSFRVTT
ncbi:hypothetical protein HMPREF1862_00792 [Varibaculum cambriense]|uniref:Uncharacterized protein n=1 Tax=Varibaculum cambriense TaxID=184870 RepID=A0AB34WZT6_9ACTO|nr:hypothetical protein HMPREF1862_00792 [Varibaculum cambriense]